MCQKFKKCSKTPNFQKFAHWAQKSKILQKWRTFRYFREFEVFEHFWIFGLMCAAAPIAAQVAFRLPTASDLWHKSKICPWGYKFDNDDFFFQAPIFDPAYLVCSCVAAVCCSPKIVAFNWPWDWRFLAVFDQKLKNNLWEMLQNNSLPINIKNWWEKKGKKTVYISKLYS